MPALGARRKRAPTNTEIETAVFANFLHFFHFLPHYFNREILQLLEKWKHFNMDQQMAEKLVLTRIDLSSPVPVRLAFKFCFD